MLDCSPVSVHIVTADRGRARAGVDVRDRPLLHHDLHDLHRLRERGGGHRHGEDLHTLHDDRYGVWCVVMASLLTMCLCVAVSSLLYAAIFGHVTTIIHNMTLATAKYHEMLDGVREFMILNEVPRNLTERVVDYVVSKWTNTKVSLNC